MNKFLVFIILCLMVMASSCRTNDRYVSNYEHDLIRIDAVADESMAKTDTVHHDETIEDLLDESSEEKCGGMKVTSIILYEVEFYPPGLKEAYETYMRRNGYADEAKNYRYRDLNISEELFTFECRNEIVALGDYKCKAIGYTTLNGMDIMVYDWTDGGYQNMVKTKKNPRIFTIEYMSYPKDIEGVIPFGDPNAIWGALDLENIPKIGEDISKYEPIKYVFYDPPYLLWKAREERKQDRTATEVSETTDSVSTDSIPRVDECEKNY